jgi:hypothetical protein
MPLSQAPRGTYDAFVMSPDDSQPRPISLLVDIASGEVAQMDEITLVSVGLQERKDLQEWITKHPDLIAPDLLLITTEFDRWEVRDQKVADRLDALFLDTSGAPVIVEFKRDKASDTVELQALKYAAYSSQLTLDELVEEFAAKREFSADESREQLLQHAPALEDGGLRSVKVLLVAGSFGPSVTSVVLWLREYDIDIGCIEVSARSLPSSTQAVITARRLIPLPEAEDYLVRRRRKEQEEERARDEPAEWTWEGYKSKYPSDQLAIARRLFDELTDYVQEHQLPWTPALRYSWLGYKRPGDYYVPLIKLRVEGPIVFAVKLPASPEELGLESPYPNLKDSWNQHSREWSWAIHSLDDVPDVHPAVDISSGFQPEKGPMQVPEQMVSADDGVASDNGAPSGAAQPAAP